MVQNIPSVGDDVYIPTVGDFLVGGLAKVIGIVEGYILTEEHANISYRWENGLDNIQGSLKKQFGSQRAYSTGVIPPCPL